jgi:transcriptional regulator with XRE-family HTH domain
MLSDSPTVARRRVRLALREAREAADITQQQVADEMDWSLSKVIRIESGDVSIAPNDLRPLLGFLHVEDRAHSDALIQDAKVARARQRHGWWQAPNFREHLSEPLRHLVEYEAEAVAIRHYHIYFLPATLQTSDYAAALMEAWDGELSAGQMRIRLRARELRRNALLSRIGRVDLFALLDESVFMRTLGRPIVLAAQLRELARLAGQSRVYIRMLPFSATAPWTNNGSFDLLSIGADDNEGGVLYRENGLHDELVEDRIATARHRLRYEKLWLAATDEAATMDFIETRLTAME